MVHESQHAFLLDSPKCDEVDDRRSYSYVWWSCLRAYESEEQAAFTWCGSKHVAGAEIAAWVALFQVDSFDQQTDQDGEQPVSLVVNVATVFGKVQQVVV